MNDIVRCEIQSNYSFIVILMDSIHVNFVRFLFFYGKFFDYWDSGFWLIRDELIFGRFSK